MAKKIVFIEEAYSDIFDIGEYYLGISEVLKQKFETDLFKTVEPIAILPISYSLYKKDYRSCHLAIFPLMFITKRNRI